MKSQTLQLAAGILMHSAMSTSAAIRFVDVNNTSPTSPYANWATASTTIQEAVDTAVAGDQILVTNGVYQTGGRTQNRVAVDVTKPSALRSVNGAAVTVIQGYRDPDPDIARGTCVSLASGATLVGFTLTNGAAGFFFSGSGAGVWCESASAVVSNCVLTGNSVGVDGSGGGAYGGTLYNCTLTGNSANLSGSGGGAASSTLYNCVLAAEIPSLFI